MKKIISPLLIIVLLAACKKNDNVEPQEYPEIDTLQGTISEDKTLDESRTYLLRGQVYVKNDAVLTIPAGTTVLVEKTDVVTDKGMLVITKGSKLFVNGAPDQPVVFTSSATEKKPGDWGAIVLLGRAPVNTVTFNMPGLKETADVDCGGNMVDDNSGSIRFLRIEYCGGINPRNEDEWVVDMPAGLCMGAVGAATKIENVMVAHSRDDGFQFVGGTVNARYLIGYNNGDDDFDFDLGYNGKLQFAVSYRIAAQDWALRANGVESLNDQDATSHQPLTRPVISNMTIIGPQGTAPVKTNLNQGVYSRKNTRLIMRNSIIAEYPQGGLMVCYKTRPLFLYTGESEFKYNLVHSDDYNRSFTWDINTAVIPDTTLTKFATNAINQNVVIKSPADLRLKTLYAAAGFPLLFPLDNSPAMKGAIFSGEDFSTFFTPVEFRGATGKDNWPVMANWTDWK